MFKDPILDEPQKGAVSQGQSAQNEACSNFCQLPIRGVASDWQLRLTLLNAVSGNLAVRAHDSLIQSSDYHNDRHDEQGDPSVVEERATARQGAWPTNVDEHHQQVHHASDRDGHAPLPERKGPARLPAATTGDK